MSILIHLAAAALLLVLGVYNVIDWRRKRLARPRPACAGTRRQVSEGAAVSCVRSSDPNGGILLPRDRELLNAMACHRTYDNRNRRP
jgi:hypothetical protein